MDLSYWEKKEWFENVDTLIIGSGIVGLSSAIEILKKDPDQNLLILEKGFLPQGASTKNAGFACFGSPSEIIDDLKNLKEKEVVSLIKSRWNGLKLLRKNLGDKNIGYKCHGGYELFFNNQKTMFDHCCENIRYINKIVYPVFKKNVFSIIDTPYNFKNILNKCIYNPFEAQLDVGKMMSSLISKTIRKGGKIINGVTVEKVYDNGEVKIKDDFEINAKKVIITANGFSKKLIDVDLNPARAQVIITKSIPNLKIKGVFHIDRGYYYFRNIDNRILLGGGRHLDKKVEQTTKIGFNEKIQGKLLDLLKNSILPETNFEIEQKWSGIMGMGNDKKPIVKKISNHLYCGVKLGGMGIAIGNNIGKLIANKIYK
tara:strand:+ start:12 stop:1124 length:1113 start_codon:yes stop_codon:yes gene_type:complete